MSVQNRPPSRPTCKHGNTNYGMHPCKECREEREAHDEKNLRIDEKTSHLVDEYWNMRGEKTGSIKIVLRRAYNLGCSDSKPEQERSCDNCDSRKRPNFSQPCLSCKGGNNWEPIQG